LEAQKAIHWSTSTACTLNTLWWEKTSKAHNAVEVTDAGKGFRLILLWWGVQMESRQKTVEKYFECKLVGGG
jgi:hypothetical protein